MNIFFPFKKSTKRSPKKLISHEKGFTLIDTMVTLALFILLTTIIAANYPDSQTKVELANAVANVQGTVRDTQLKASAVQNSKDMAGGYGLYFSKATSTSFVQFKDLSLVVGEDPTKFAGNGLYDGPTELSQTVSIPDGFHISNICVGNSTARPFDNALCSNTNSSLGTVTVEYPRSSNQPVIIADNNLSTKYAAACIEFSADKSNATGNVKNLILSVSGFTSTALGGCNQPPTNVVVSEGTTVNGSLATNMLSGNGKDVIAPSLALNGANPLYIAQGSSYTDPGATATDDIDGNISSKIVTKVESVTKKIYQTTSAYVSSTSISPHGVQMAIVYDKNLERLNIMQADGMFSYKNGLVTKISGWNVLPVSIVSDSSNNLYVVNYNSNTVTKITQGGAQETFGFTGASPRDIAIDASGNIYVANSSGTVTKITPTGVSSTLGTAGSGVTRAITIDSAGNIYTANSTSNNVTKITPAGVSSVFGTTGTSPVAITIDSAGNIYTLNSSSRNITKITPTGRSETFGSLVGSYLQGIVVNQEGNIYVASAVDSNVQIVSQLNQTTQTSVIDTNVLGDYLVRYSVSDSAGNKAETTRDVIIQ